MMWRIFNLLFGWDHVLYKFGGDWNVYKLKKVNYGHPVCCHFMYGWRTINDPNEVVWLTCGPSKYAPKGDK